MLTFLIISLIAATVYVLVFLHYAQTVYRRLADEDYASHALPVF